MKKAIITGVTGQDGSYLAELLLTKGYEVHGVVRRSSTENFDRIAHLSGRIVLHQADLLDQLSIIEVFKEVRPDEVYNLARRLAGGARKAIRWTKVTTNLALRQLAHMIMDTGLAYEALTNVSKDHQEAVAAFRDKRKPIFTGE